MKVKKNCIEKVQDWADDKLRQMCGRITPGKRLTVILLMFVFFGGMSIYITVSSIYNIGNGTGSGYKSNISGSCPYSRQTTVSTL